MNLQNARTFESVRAQVIARANAALPDAIVRVADLRMTPEGHLALPGDRTYRLNDWSRKNLASMLGLRWEDRKSVV